MKSPHFFYRVVYALSVPILFGFRMFFRLRQQFFNLNFPGSLVLLATLALSACASGGNTRKVWSKPEIIDHKRRGGSPNIWQLLFDAQGNGMFVTNEVDRVWASRYTVDSGWGNPQLIDDMANPAEEVSYGDFKNNVRLFLNANGGALAVWHQNHGLHMPYKTWSNRYTVANGWGKAEQFDNTPGDDLSPEIVGDTRGNAFAVWTHNNVERDSHQLRAKIYIPDIGWGKATLIAESSGTAKMLMLKVDTLGNAYALWLQGNVNATDKAKGQPRAKAKFVRSYDHARSYEVWISRYTASSGWGKATLILRDAQEGNALQMALDGRGNALVAWEQKVVDDRGIWVSHYLADKGWDQAVRIDPPRKYGDAREPEITFDTQGNAMVMWWQAGSDGNVFARRYTPSSGWDTVTTVSSQTQSALRARLVYDKDGNALAVWTQLDRQSGKIIMASRYSIGVGWNAPVVLSENSKDGKTDPRIAIDAEGNAIAVWWQRGGRGASIWINQYDAVKGWGAAKLLQTDSTGTATGPEVTFDATGIAHVSWTRMPSENESYRVWSSRLMLTQALNQQLTRNSPQVKKSRYGDGHARSSIGYTALHNAAFDGKTDKVAQLIAGGMDINVKDYDEGTPLHVAANQGQKDVVELLIAKGANVNARNRKGETPLHQAASWGTREAAEILIAKGANLHAKDSGYSTPLHNAATRGNTGTVELLIAKGAAVNALTLGGASPLSNAVYENRKDIVALLLVHGAVTNLQGGDDTTPLHRAASKGNMDIVTLLLSHGAIVNIQNSVEHTPLHHALFDKRSAIAELLIARGADVKAILNDGDTMLHMVQTKETAALLIARGVNINARGSFGYTPLHRAASKGRADVAGILIEKGADINDRDNEGETPLDVAQAKSQHGIAAILEAHGAKKGVESGRKYVPVGR